MAGAVVQLTSAGGIELRTPKKRDGDADRCRGAVQVDGATQFAATAGSASRGRPTSHISGASLDVPGHAGT